MKGNKLAGIFLILFGGLYLAMQVLDEMNIVIFQFWDLWPLFTICVGLMFEVGYFQTKRAPGILIPGGIVTTIGALHLFESLTNWYFAEYTWPIYVLAVAIGFFQYWLVTKESWALVITYILMAVFTFLAFIVVSMIFDGLISANLAFSIILIVVGLLIVFSGSRRHT